LEEQLIFPSTLGKKGGIKFWGAVDIRDAVSHRARKKESGRPARIYPGREGRKKSLLWREGDNAERFRKGAGLVAMREKERKAADRIALATEKEMEREKNTNHSLAYETGRGERTVFLER